MKLLLLAIGGLLGSRKGRNMMSSTNPQKNACRYIASTYKDAMHAAGESASFEREETEYHWLLLPISLSTKI